MNTTKIDLKAVNIFLEKKCIIKSIGAENIYDIISSFFSTKAEQNDISRQWIFKLKLTAAIQDNTILNQFYLIDIFLGTRVVFINYWQTHNRFKKWGV